MSQEAEYALEELFDLDLDDENFKGAFEKARGLFTSELRGISDDLDEAKSDLDEIEGEVEDLRKRLNRAFDAASVAYARLHRMGVTVNSLEGIDLTEVIEAVKEMHTNLDVR